MTSAVIDPSFIDSSGEQVGDWMPTRYTPSLSGTEDFSTQGGKLLTFASKFWSIPDTWPARVQLFVWQAWLIRHVLEVYPEDWPVEHLRGQLRFRQVVISMGRQNGKSVIGALFVIFFLCLHVKGPRVLGMASVDRQAKIVYDRVRFAIDKSERLARELRTTATRGISRRDGTGLYQTLPAKEESAQGEPSSGSIYDELHLGLAALWDALVLAMRARRNALLIGLTTAGDDSSELLIRLYREGEAAIAGNDERFGFFVWEADSDELTEENVIAANPAIACGAVPLDLAMAEAQKMWNDQTRGPDGLTGRQRVIRYTLNRFITGAADAWASMHAWLAGNTDDAIDHGTASIVYGIERTDGWEAVSITATSKHDNTFRTELVATFNDANQDVILEACKLLARGPGTPAFAMDTVTLGPLATALRDEGIEAWKLGASEMIQAAQTAHAAIAQRRIQHPSDPLVRIQMARGRWRILPEAKRLSRSLSLGDIDTLIGLIVSVHVADVRPEPTNQLF